MINTSTTHPGWQLSVFDWNVVLFGVLIIVFLIAEPLGLFGIWVRHPQLLEAVAVQLLSGLASWCEVGSALGADS